MKERAGILISGDTKVFQSSWNSRHDPKIEYGTIKLYKDDDTYTKLREDFCRFADQHVMKWDEEVDIEYSDQELESYELLRLRLVGQAGLGGNQHTDVYATEPLRSVCGRTIYRQIRNLVLDFSLQEPDPFEIGYFQHDLCQTKFGNELVMLSKLKELLEDQHIPGVTFRPTESIASQVVPHATYYQLLVEREIGPLVEPTQVEWLDYCEACNQYKRVAFGAWPPAKGSEFYFSRKSYSGDWIMRTTERFGQVPNFRCDFIINQALYRLWKEHSITGFWVQPVHLV